MLPFIAFGISLITSAVGIAKTAEAIENFQEAKRIVEQAERRYKSRKQRVEEALKGLEVYLEELGRLYLEIYRKDFRAFTELMKKVSDTELVIKSTPQIHRQWKKDIPSFEKGIDLAEKILEGVLISGITGVKTAIFTYIGTTGIAIQIGSASTGTALSTLSGAALRNALLSWFGGGSLASGGLGVAGGTLVLGGILVGPSILIGGFLLNKKSQKVLTEAKKYELEVEKAIARLRIFERNIEIVKTKVDEELYILPKLRKLFNREMQKTEKLFYKAKSDFKYRDKFIKHLKMTYSLGKTLKNLIDIPLVKDLETFEYNPSKGAALKKAQKAVRKSESNLLSIIWRFFL